MDSLNDKSIKLKSLYRGDIPEIFNEFRLLNNQWERVDQILKNHKLPPYEVIIHPTCTCNLRCKWCIGQNLKTGQIESEVVKENLINPDEMLKVVKNLCSFVEHRTIRIGDHFEEKEYAIENVSFSGLIGEPLTAKESVLSAMEYLCTQNKRVGIFTNGLLIDDQIAEVFSNINYVLISLDAANNETYNYMKCASQKNDCFDKVVNNIRLLNDVKKRNCSNLDINIGFVVNQYNYKEILDAAKLMKGIGVHYFRLKFDIAIKLKLSPDELSAVSEQIKYIRENIEDDYFKLVEIHKMSEVITSDQNRNFNTCLINKLFGAIGPDGGLYACNYHAKKGGILLGDLLHESFSKIWSRTDHSDVGKCPFVCDPFKNRANNMLNALKELHDTASNEDFYKTMELMGIGL